MRRLAAAVDADRANSVRVHDPLRDAHDVRAAVANLAAAEIEQPAELAVRMFRVVGNVAGRADPGVVVKLGRWRGVGRPVAGRTGVMPASDLAHSAELAIADIGGGLIGGWLRASLGAYLNDAAVALGGAHHGAAFLDGETRRLLDIDVLASLARQDGHERMPMVGCGDEDGVHILVFEQTAEILVELGTPADACGGLIEPGGIDVAEGDGTSRA